MTLRDRAVTLIRTLDSMGADRASSTVRELLAALPSNVPAPVSVELWGKPTDPIPATDRSWCNQCDRRVDAREMASCRSQFCRAAKAA